MKKIIVIIVTILSISAVVAGKLHWDNKIEAKAAEAQSAESETSTEEIETVVEENVKVRKQEIEKHAKNLPEDIRAKLITAFENEKPVNFVILGSSSTPEDENGWPALFKKELLNTYGEDILQVTIKEIADKTSAQVVQEGLYEEVAALAPDILLFEPFLLFDNGKVRFEDRLVNFTTIIEAFETENPDVSVLLQPANPIYQATYYPNEVNVFQTFAIDNGYTYLNHWEAWPDYQTDAILEYLTDSEPNEKGHQLWAEYLTNYFVAKK